MKQEIIEEYVDPEAVRQRVRRGMELFDQRYGPGWPARFANKPVQGVGYTAACQECVADIASGLSEGKGWLTLIRGLPGRAMYGVTLYHAWNNRLGWNAENAILTKVWQEEIDRRLAAGVQV